MTPRQQRIADLKAARARIDQQLARFGVALDELPTEQPVAHIHIANAADFARRLVWNGMTHAEVAAQLHIHVDSVAGLIAPRPSYANGSLGRIA